MYERDTIAAISTAAGEGGIGIVRLSGPDSLAIAQLLFRRDRDGGLTSHRFSYGHIHDPLTGDVVDEVMLVYMAPPHTYTREPVVEIQCHGGTFVVDRLLQLVLAQGARLARPGEFTRRAFLNGRIDLLQAEAVIDLIRSKSEASLALAQRQSQGLLSERFAFIRQRLITPLALMEAYLDFPEDEVGELHAVEIDAALALASDSVDTLLSTFTEGRLLRDGISVVIAGRPNVG
ncbi:MAG TPA: tRNA uridine-5-carboxymethylaminomethyl(34) synthesis GTPase MnmE, partial [Geobacterales bacterium]|nr:tRNA uridine-5-carboxymethylaminomethyl(34) synthesis GTPase MnmE [Geobacterales bacterium]